MRFLLLFTLGLIAVAACGTAGPPAPRTRTNILLITLDTTRADRLGRGFTPALDRVASQGLRFTNARTVAPLTLPAHVSMMTGWLPTAHGVRLNGSARFTSGETIAGELKEAGYSTRAVVGAFVLDRRFGLDAGFDEYDDRIARNPKATDVLEAERPANDVIDRAIASLDVLPADGPWFLWVHVYDAHAPYRPPAAALARAGGRPYDGEIAFVDGELSRLFARLEARPDSGRTATIVVGDHGESLGEHGEATHGMLLFEAAIRVPLIIKAPGVAAGERHDAASVLDVARTVSGMTGGNPDGWMGRNLLDPVTEDVEAYSETDYPTLASWSPVRALVNGRWKLIQASRPQLFDIENDSDEQTDLSSAQPALAQSMTARIDQIRHASLGVASVKAPSTQTGTLPADTAARLRSLGYVSSGQPVSPPAADAPDPATAMGAWTDFEAALVDTTAGRPTLALPRLARLASAYPSSALFASTYARALADAGRERDALVRFRSAVANWPGDWSLYHELAVVARSAGLAEEALRAEEAALAIAPEEPLALNGQGLLMADAGRDADAARAFEAAVERDPTNAVYLANLGNARRATGDLTGAAEAYRRALDRNPALPDALNGLGVVLVQQGRPADAVQWLELAARDPGFIEAHLNFGIALQQSGDRASAVAQLRKVASASGPYSREREAARALLAQLESR